MMEAHQGDRRHDALGDFRVLSDELVCKILSLQSLRDIGSLACVSSVFYILCNEEPLWMQLYLENHEGSVDFNGTWKTTALAKLDLSGDIKLYAKPHLQFQGFSSAFLYRRWYRCHVALEGFTLDKGAVERRTTVPPEEFSVLYDGKKPILLTDLLNDWPARKNWSLNQLVQKCGDSVFRVVQPHGKPVSMTMENFAAYMELQHDEEPLYVFDPKFGESVPELLKDYKVPTLFSEDLFSVLSETERPSFRWIVMGPAKSGAAWHVDPSLTSAWNALLSGRKRWALYRPGKVPPGVTLDVDEDDGSVRFDGPSSLQWWLDVYPHLNEEDKPLECTQLPGETIYVPSGWWHCVLNIDASVAVTQNFVNVNTLEIVCMDLAPGYRHRAIARAGVIALEGKSPPRNPENQMVFCSPGGSGRRYLVASVQPLSDCSLGIPVSDDSKDDNCKVSFDSESLVRTKSVGGVTDQNLLLALDTHLKETQPPPGETKKGKDRGDSTSRKWLRKLWSARPELQEKIWNGACLALDAGTWLQRINVICKALGLPSPANEEQLPVGDGSNPVYLFGDYVCKLYIQENGPAASIDGLGSELNFYAVLKDSGSSLQHVVPEVVASGILYPNEENYIAVPWDGTGDCSQVYKKDLTGGMKRQRESPQIGTGRIRTKWSARRRNLKSTVKDPLAQEPELWPYLVTKRCQGRPLEEVLKNMTQSELECLAKFLGKQMCLLHTLPLPSLEQSAADDSYSDISSPATHLHKEESVGRDSKEAKVDAESPFISVRFAQLKDTTSLTCITANLAGDFKSECASDKLSEVPDVWQMLVSYLREQRKSAYRRLDDWGTLPEHLLKQVEVYLPKDPVVLVSDIQVHEGVATMGAHPVWLHVDIMSDNIIVEQSTADIKGRYIIDFGDIFQGDPIYDILPVHLDVFNLDANLLECFLRSYRLPLSSKTGVRYVRGAEGAESVHKYRLSYCAMCYCLLHELDAVARIFKLRPDLKKATSIEEIEDAVWGVLNAYSPEDSADRYQHSWGAG